MGINNMENFIIFKVSNEWKSIKNKLDFRLYGYHHSDGNIVPVRAEISTLKPQGRTDYKSTYTSH